MYVLNKYNIDTKLTTTIELSTNRQHIRQYFADYINDYCRYHSDNLIKYEYRYSDDFFNVILFKTTIKLNKGYFGFTYADTEVKDIAYFTTSYRLNKRFTNVKMFMDPVSFDYTNVFNRVLDELKNTSLKTPPIKSKF